MIKILKQIELELPDLLKQPEIWQTLDINYEKPHVERVWTQWNQYRINLHRIHPCEFHECFFHPHPWASVVRILSGRYEMLVGQGSGEVSPPTTMTLILEKDSIYEMTNKDGWHQVRPLDHRVMSLMITDAPWGRKMPKSDKIKLSSLTDEVRDDIMNYFIWKYRK